MIKNFIIIVLFLSLTSCFKAPSPNPTATPAATTAKKLSDFKLQKYDYANLKGWNEQNISAGFSAFKKTCAVIDSGKVRSKKIFSNNIEAWKNECSKAQSAQSGKKYFEDNFTPYLVKYKGSAQGKSTGYFKIEIAASLERTSVYKYPIYRAPDDSALLDLSRKEIENGALDGKGLEIAYAKSAADLYFLHIQGSGILALPDGSKILIGFQAKNNKEYTSIGNYMLEHDLIEHGTAEDIKAWLENHPVSGRSITNMNDRYVFFVLKQSGTFGSLGVDLTDQGSLAVDPAYIALGLPIWLQTSTPDGKGFNRLVNAQDTGSDIKGPIRGDVYFGSGDYARNTASGMKNPGSYFILLPKRIKPDPYF